MNFNLLLYKVHGLNNPASISILRNYVASNQGLDILFLQEHGLKHQIAQDLGSKLWPWAKTWCLEASPWYNNDPEAVGANCSGIITLLHPKLAK